MSDTWTDTDERMDRFERGAYDETRLTRCTNDECAFARMTFKPNVAQDVCLACLEPLEELQ